MRSLRSFICFAQNRIKCYIYFKYCQQRTCFHFCASFFIHFSLSFQHDNNPCTHVAPWPEIMDTLTYDVMEQSRREPDPCVATRDRDQQERDMGMASWPHKTWSWTAGGLWAWAGNTRAEPQSSTYILEDPVPVGAYSLSGCGGRFSCKQHSQGLETKRQAAQAETSLEPVISTTKTSLPSGEACRRFCLIISKPFACYSRAETAMQGGVDPMLVAFGLVCVHGDQMSFRHFYV